MSPKRLRVLTWHVHGNYLYYLSQAPHDFYVITKPNHPPGYAGCVGHLPWGENVREVPYECVPDAEFDCVLYQHHRHYAHDREYLLSAAQRALPAIFVEHDPPREHPTDTCHPVQNPNVLLVHVTPFNALMWDSGVTPTRVIEHGVLLPRDVVYRGTLPKGVTVVNHLVRRGRRLGSDLFETVRHLVPVDLVGMGSAQAGGIGAHAFAGEHAALSIGSSSVMIAHVRFKRTDIRHAILSMPSPIPDTYFVMAENGIGGAALKHFIEQQVYADDPFGALPRDDCFARLQKAIDATPPGSGGVMFMPWLAGSLAPHADASMRGGVVNLGLDATRSHLARAVLEGVAMNLRWLRGPVEAFAKRRFSHFVFYGGGAESDAWSQIVADVLDAPVHRIEQPQYTTCVGVALLAFQRLGLLGFDDFASRVRIRGVCEPNRANARVYAEMSAQFVEAFRRNRPIFRALQRNLRRPASAAANGLRPSG